MTSDRNRGRRVRGRTRLVVASVLAFLALAVTIWIVVPGPTYFFLRLSVGAPETAAWWLASSMVALALTVGAPRSRGRRATRMAATVALLLAVSPFVRLPSALRRLDAAFGDFASATGDDAKLLRTAHVSLVDLFRGVPLGEVRSERGVAVATVSGTPLTVDVHRPPAAGVHPIIVQIYGGSWQHGSPASNEKAARWLASLGYVVFAIDYRHAPAARWPAQLDDVRLALGWIASHAVDYGADTTRITLMGRSAGAHLALMAAYAGSPVPIRGVVSWYGPVDLVDAYLNPPRPDPLDIRAIEDTLFGAPLSRMRDRYREASPLAHAGVRQPPTLLLYGARDRIVERRYGQRLATALARSGTRVAYLEIPWADHAFDEVFNGPSNQLALFYVERFLRAVNVP